MLRLNNLNGFGKRGGEDFDFTLGLHALWRFESTDPNYAHPQDDSGRGNHLVLSGYYGTWASLTGKPPAASRAYEMVHDANANRRKLKLPSGALASDLAPGLTGSFTWGIWCEPTVASGNMGLVDKWQSGQREFHVFYNHIGYEKKFTFLVSSDGANPGTGGFLASAATYEPSSGPIFVVCSYNYAEGLMKMSINGGTWQTVAQALGAKAGTSEIAIGSGWNYLPIWTGWIGSIAYWNRSLSQAEVTALYAAGAGTPDM